MQPKGWDGMGHGRSEDYWSFETIIVISKAMQDQFQVDWLAHYSILELQLELEDGHERDLEDSPYSRHPIRPHVTTCVPHERALCCFSL